MLILEGAQAGLSWLTVLKKREGYRAAFAQFEVEKVATFDDADVARLRENPQIIRNRLKIEAAITNARAFLAIQEEYGSFDAFIWQFVDDLPIQNTWSSLADVPASTETSKIMSKALKQRGFKFVGETICYAYMQSVGMVNDHTTDCFRHAEVASLQSTA